MVLTGRVPATHMTYNVRVTLRAMFYSALGKILLPRLVGLEKYECLFVNIDYTFIPTLYVVAKAFR